MTHCMIGSMQIREDYFNFEGEWECKWALGSRGFNLDLREDLCSGSSSRKVNSLLI